MRDDFERLSTHLNQAYAPEEPGVITAPVCVDHGRQASEGPCEACRAAIQVTGQPEDARALAATQVLAEHIMRERGAPIAVAIEHAARFFDQSDVERTQCLHKVPVDHACSKCAHLNTQLTQ